jgi:hypothetical protein
MADKPLQVADQRPQDRALKNVLVDNFRPEHVTMVLDAASRVLTARIAAGMLELKTTLRIREKMQALQDDTSRAKAAAEWYEILRQDLDAETRSEMAALIIKAQLGVVR